MMIAFDGFAFAIGLAIGAVVSGLFFAGLGLGMRYALRQRNPLPFLAVSAALRMAMLLVLGWAVATQAGAWALGGYALAFVITRFIATSLAKSGGAA
jgi:hypothetical protein